ncbi:MAG: RES family NAD+ phosphorylase [Chitinophagaceae bacterium]|nr:RES family NAD+ phosphorylase [Chitinophagaceae bacterium]
MILYRVCRNKYRHDLSGSGARVSGGRWNSAGRAALYTSGTKSLAILEVLTNTPLAILKDDFTIVTLELPDGVSIDEYKLSDMPAEWHSYPVPIHVMRMGDRWLASGRSLVLKVPSAVVFSEHNWVINPAHPEFDKVKIAGTERLVIDPRIEKNRQDPYSDPV